MKAYTPERGDIAWIQFSPHVGHEQAHRRPALVLSPQKYNDLAQLAVVCPISRTVRQYPFVVKLPDGLETRGVVLADQVQSVAWASRGAEFKEKATPETLDEVLARIAALIGPF